MLAKLAKSRIKCYLNSLLGSFCHMHMGGGDKPLH